MADEHSRGRAELFKSIAMIFHFLLHAFAVAIHFGAVEESMVRLWTYGGEIDGAIISIGWCSRSDELKKKGDVA
jgi:hypothetical protein